MRTSEDVVVPSGNISLAWGLAFLRAMRVPGGRLRTPLLVSVDEFDDSGEPREIPEIRRSLDAAIESVNRSKRRGSPVVPVSSTAQTIFPHMCWSPHRRRPADQLFEHYLQQMLPRLKSRCKLNRRGTYFSRMIHATGVGAGAGTKAKCVNQLGDILAWWHRSRGRIRASALQVSVYDPAKDHTGSALSGFPCLQQVSFSKGRDGLILTAYYPSEYIFERGYGNYLGLCRLGAFMACEMGLRLDRVDVFIAVPSLGGTAKHLLRPLEHQVQAAADRAAHLRGSESHA